MSPTPLRDDDCSFPPPPTSSAKRVRFQVGCGRQGFEVATKAVAVPSCGPSCACRDYDLLSRSPWKAPCFPQGERARPENGTRPVLAPAPPHPHSSGQSGSPSSGSGSRAASTHAALVMPVTVDESQAALPVGEWKPVEIQVTLDSGACDHILDAEDAPGYEVQPSMGSRRGRNFVFGNGETVPNEGEVLINMESPDGAGGRVPVRTTFQVAEINRPLMSVARICDQGLTCVFDKDGARVMDSSRNVVSHFQRQNNLYVATMQIGPPEPFARQAP